VKNTFMNQAKDMDSVFAVAASGLFGYLAALSIDGWLSLGTNVLALVGGALGVILLIIRIRVSTRDLKSK